MAGLVPARHVTAQARRPLSVAADSTAVLSAIRAIDLRQLCRCRTVLLDSVVRRMARIQIYSMFSNPAALVLSREDVGRLQLAGHRITRTALGTFSHAGRDSVLVAVQLLPPRGAVRQILVVATPPDGLTATHLVTLELHRRAWRVQGVRSVFEP